MALKDTSIRASDLAEVLTSKLFHEETGATPVNVCDGLYAIATAINRLADVHAMTAAQTAQSSQLIAQIMASSDGPRGHG